LAPWKEKEGREGQHFLTSGAARFRKEKKNKGEESGPITGPPSTGFEGGGKKKKKKKSPDASPFQRVWQIIRRKRGKKKKGGEKADPFLDRKRGKEGTESIPSGLGGFAQRCPGKEEKEKKDFQKNKCPHSLSPLEGKKRKRRDP